MEGMMEEIVRVTIKGASGYTPLDESYKDKLVITPDSITYEYKPYSESRLETNIYRKWTYKTTNPIFKELYKKVAVMTSFFLHHEGFLMAEDVGPTIISAVYCDKHRESAEFFCPSEFFKDYFSIIKEMVPRTEYIPAVLLTNDDYSDE